MALLSISRPLRWLATTKDLVNDECMKQRPEDFYAPAPRMLHSKLFEESQLFSLLPIAVSVYDTSGTIINFNRKAAELWGRAPKAGDASERFCGSAALYEPEGKAIRHSDSPVALCLADGMTKKGVEMIIERPDLSRLRVKMDVSPIFSEEGNLLGAINCFSEMEHNAAVNNGKERLLQILKEGENQFYGVFQNLKTPLYTTDRQGRITFYNKAAANLWGREPEINKETWQGSVWSNQTSDDSNLEDLPVQFQPDSGKELVVEKRDGTRAIVVPYPTPLYDGSGNVSGNIIVLIDITDRKVAEKALLDSERRYRSVLQGMPVAIYTIDSQGYISTYNKAAASLWGREPEIGKELWSGSWKIYNPDGSELPLEQCPMARTLREAKPIFGEEILVVRPDGSMRHVAPHPQPIFNESGELTGAINMLIDVTDIKISNEELREREAKYRQLSSSLETLVEEKTLDLKRKNEELQRSEERYHKMVEEVEDYAIILLDSRGLIQNWNKGAEKIKGYKEEEIVGKSFSQFYLPADQERGLPHILLERARQTGKAVHEGWRQRKDGSQFWGSIVLTALHDDHNNVIGFSKVTRDLTERKIAEDKMREYNNELEFQNKELEQFAYAASHDLKEPLRKIHFYNCSIAENDANHLDEKSREYLNRSINAVRRMTDLIEDLLMYSRTTSNIDSFQEVDLNEIVDEIALLHNEEFDQKKVIMQVQKLPVLWGVPFQFKQLMANLVNNAIKYKHPERQLVITIRNEEIAKGSEIREREIEAEQFYNHISVSDNGIGFEAQYSEKIFEIFQRLSNHSGAKGSGIGLAICKKIVQNHRGFIRASGNVNEGAKFDIYLPVAG